MRYSKSSAVVLAALSISGAVAGPTHRHRHLHEKKEANPMDWESLNWDEMGIDWTSAWAAGQASKTSATAQPTSTSVAASTTEVAVAKATKAAKPSSSSSSSAAAASTSKASVTDDLKDDLNSIAADVVALFDAIHAHSNDRTSFGGVVATDGTATDFTAGNFGIPYGSNIIKIDSVGDYAFTNNFINTQSKAITVNIWNKCGSDGRALSGSALAPEDTTLTFILKPGESQLVAFDKDSLVAWAEVCTKKAVSGAYSTTWGEASFHTTGSAYDVSAIMNGDGNNYKMSISSEEATQCVSDNTQNFWLTDTQPIGDSNGSCFISQSHAHLTTKMGGRI